MQRRRERLPLRLVFKGAGRQNLPWPAFRIEEAETLFRPYLRELPPGQHQAVLPIPRRHPFRRQCYRMGPEKGRVGAVHAQPPSGTPLRGQQGHFQRAHDQQDQQQTQDPGEPLLPLSPDADHPQHQESQGAHSRRQQEQ